MRSSLVLMGRLASLVLALATLIAVEVHATRYPPGPGNAYPDTLRIENLQNSAAVPFLAASDTVYGIRGIITGFDTKSSGYAFYLQNSTGAAFTGVDVFTASYNKQATPYDLQIGDSVVVYGKKQEFQGETEIEGYDAVQGTDDCIVRKVSSGNALPPFYVGTTTQLRETPTNTNGEKYECMLVRINQTGANTLKVVRTVGLGANAFLLVDSAAPSDSVFVDGNTLATYSAPALGTPVTFVQGILNQRTRGYRIQLRDGNDILAATPPNVIDAYPVADNQVRVVFDRDVTPASATNIGNYSLASFGSVISATMASGSVSIVTIANGLPHGVNETITVNGVAGLANSIAMTSGQSRTFINGVLSIAEIQQANPDSLARVAGCLDMSRFAGGYGQTSQGLGGTRCTIVGVMTGKFTPSNYLEDESGGQRSGVQVFAPPLPMVLGRKYMVVGAVQEFFGETEFTSVVAAFDLGLATTPMPTQPSLSVYDHTGCDATGLLEDAEDYEGVLLRLNYGKVVLAQGLVSPPTNGFHVANFTGTDTIFVSNFNSVLGTNPITPPALGSTVQVTGVLGFSTSFRLLPRSWADVALVYDLAFALHVFVDGAGTVERSTSSDSVFAGSSVTLTAVPNPGHRFVGWTGDVVSSSNPLEFTMTSDRTLTAHFEPIPRFTVSASVDSGGTVTRMPDLADYLSGDVVTLSAVPDTGWVFVGWQGDTATLANPLAMTVTRDRSVTARFVRVRDGYSACVTANENELIRFGDASGGVITAIEFASYGTPTGTCGEFALSSCHAARSLAVVESLAVGRSSVEFTVSNALFGEPCGGTAKRIVIQYHVEGGTPAGPATVTICRVVPEGAQLDLYAPAGMTIDSVLFASYGTPVVAPLDTCDMQLGACDATSSRAVVEALALGSGHLSVMASNVVFGEPCANTSKRLAVKLLCRAPNSDLVAVAPAGWPAAVVPSASPIGGTTPTVPAELWGDSLGTYVSAAFRADHLSALVPWQASIAVDGVSVALATPLPELAAGSGWSSVRDEGPIRVAGGWHTVTSTADAGAALGESNESNNSATSQWLWRPSSLQRGTVYSRPAPPATGGGPRANCDAFGFVRDPRYAWVVAIGQTQVLDRFRLSVCDDYAGPTSGLTHVLASSPPETGTVDFVAGGSTSSPSQLYATVVREALAGGGGYDIQYSDSRGAFSDVGTGVWTDRTLAAGHLAQVYELYFETLAPKYLALRNSGGLAFEVLDQAVAAKHSSGIRGRGVPTGDGVDSLVYLPQRVGWHSVVISRTNPGRQAVPYTFLSQDHPVLGTEADAAPARLECSSPWPNPVRGLAQLQLALPAAANARVEVFDVGGRQVRVLHDGALPAGRHTMRWDCRDAAGSAASPGLYLVRATVGGWKTTRRLVVR